MSAAVAVQGARNSGFEVLAQQSQQTRRIHINVRRERITTVLARSTEFVGDMGLKEGVKLDGHMRGNLSFGGEDGLAIISRTATLQGNLQGPRALVMGTIEGDVFIHGLLMLSPTAMVMGNIYYDRLIVHDGAQISGVMHMNRADAANAAIGDHDIPALSDAIDIPPGSKVVRSIRAAASAPV